MVDATGDGAIIEITHDQIAVRKLVGSYDYATNRFRAPHMVRLNASRGVENETRCQVREKLLAEFLGSDGRLFDVEDAMNALRLHGPDGRGVCNHNATRFGIVAHPATGTFLLAEGHICEAHFQVVWQMPLYHSR